MKHFFNFIKYTLLIFFIGLICLHLFIKDRHFLTGVVFYATPLPLIIIFGMLINLLFLRTKKVFVILAIINIGLSIYFFTHYFGSPQEPSGGKTHTSLFWNVAQSRPLPTQTIIKHAKEDNVEIIALVEAHKVPESDKLILKNALPGYEFRTMYGTMLIGVRGSIEDVAFHARPNVYKLNHIKALINEKETSILMVDVNAVPMIDKGIPLGIVNKYLEKHKVDVILGDFNTPYESIFFEGFEKDYQSFHPYSAGMTSTWPLPFPVIEIDQIWLDRSRKPIKLEKFCYPESDHKLLIAEFQ